MLFDVHTHIHFPIYDEDREAVIERARKAGIKMLCVGTQAASSQAAVDLARKYPGEIWATSGFHPNHVARAQHARNDAELTENAEQRGKWHHDPKEQKEPYPEQFDALNLREIAKNKEVVAIGECGLDYYRLSGDGHQALREKEDQQEAFEVQIQIAKDLNKALMMHCRPSKGSDDAYEEALRVLSTYDGLPPRVFHFYVGSSAMTKKLVESGACFTFGGVITFARDYDEQIKYIPLDRILLETDAPYAAPNPHRGKRNEPSYIIETAKKLAGIKGVDFEKVIQQTTKNALTVFKIQL